MGLEEKFDPNQNKLWKNNFNFRQIFNLIIFFITDHNPNNQKYGNFESLILLQNPKPYFQNPNPQTFTSLHTVRILPSLRSPVPN